MVRASLLAIFTPPRTQLSRTTDRLQLIVAGIFSYQHSCRRRHRSQTLRPLLLPLLHFIYISIAFFVLSSVNHLCRSLSLSLSRSRALSLCFSFSQLDFQSIFDLSRALFGRFLWESIWHSKRLVITVNNQTGYRKMGTLRS